MRLTREQKQLRTMERAQKLQRWIDPAAAASQVSVLDAAGGAAGQLRDAEREHKTNRLLAELVAEQKRANELLAALVNQQVHQQVQQGV